jgi:hypothetical protein
MAGRGRRRCCGTVEITRAGLPIAVWPLRSRGVPSLAMVGELARWRLEADRVGCVLRLVDVDPALAELVELAGLAELLLG